MLYKLPTMWYNIRRRDFVMGQNTIPPTLAQPSIRFERSINLMISEKPSDHRLCSYFFIPTADNASAFSFLSA